MKHAACAAALYNTVLSRWPVSTSCLACDKPLYVLIISVLCIKRLSVGVSPRFLAS
ncbi:hypothetical protein SXCC_02202 [Gluconacetobacter sp. SXCC-1]|nr:hypothetical protein SXCC_02202 [Gluconacetobacter sp. SXCC-1]